MCKKRFVPFRNVEIIQNVQYTRFVQFNLVLLEGYIMRPVFICCLPVFWMPTSVL